jgi:histone H3/H4
VGTTQVRLRQTRLTLNSAAGSNDPPTEAPARLFGENAKTSAQPPEAVANVERSEDATMSRYGKFGYDVEVAEQDKLLPIANVARIMRAAVPKNAKISKEAKECMQDCVTEFVSFITSEAVDISQAQKLKTVGGEHILDAMTKLGFENYSEALQVHLAKYRKSVYDQGENQRPDTAGSRRLAPAAPDGNEDEVESSN